MQAANGARHGARGKKRAIKVEDDVLSLIPKRLRQNEDHTQTSRKSLKSEESDSPSTGYHILPPAHMERQSFPASSTTSTTSFGTSLSSDTDMTNNTARFIMSTPSQTTGSPSYAYFKHSVPFATTAVTSIGRSAPQSTSNTRAPAQASPSPALHQRLESQLEVRHATLLAHINARYTHVLEDDRRRRAAYQAAAYQRSMEINVEEHWGRELTHMLGLTSPILSTSASAASAASQQHAHAVVDHKTSPASIEIQHNRAYLELLVTNTDMNISALRDAHRVAYEREVIEAQLSARVLRELEVRRDTLVLLRAQEARCAVGGVPVMAEFSSSLAKTKCTKSNCLGCSKDGCVSDEVVAVRERVQEMARRLAR